MLYKRFNRSRSP